MSENFQNPSVLGTLNSLKHSLPVMSNATSLTGSVCNFSRVSAPAISSASATGTSFQTLVCTAYLHQHSSTTMLSGVTNQSQISTSAASYPGVLHWDITGSTEKNSSSLGDFTLAITDQHIAASSMFMAVQYDKTADPNNMVPIYPSLSASLPQGRPSQIPNQGHSLSLPYQEGRQVYYCNQGTLGTLLYGELGSCMQSYGSVSYTGRRASVQPEMVMVLREIQPTNIQPPASTSGIYYPVSAQPITETSFQETPDIHQLLACTDPLSQEEQPGSENADLGKNSLSLENLGTPENGMESSSGFADITTLAEHIHLPQLFNSLKDPDQSKRPNMIKARDNRAIKVNQVQKKPSVIKVPSDQPRKKKHKASEPISGAPRAKIQPKNPERQLGEEVVLCNAAVSDRAPVNAAKDSKGKTQKAASREISKTKSHGQEKTKRIRGRKKAEENKQSRNKVKAEEKPTIPQTKRKQHQTELIQESFKMPRTDLCMCMLESVKVFHALGKKNDKRTGLSSCRVLGNSSNLKHPQPPPAIQPWRNTPRDGKGPEKTQVEGQKPDSSAEKECPSPAQYELPPPGKVKLIPLHFSAWEKPQARPAPRRPQSLASYQPAIADHVHPASTNLAQPAAVSSSQPAPASLPGPVKPAQPTVTNPTQPGWTDHTQASVPWSAVPRPAPYKTSSFTSLQWEPVPPAVTKCQSPAKLQTPFLLQDFSKKPVPWREPNVPEPVMSKPIELQQRPEREAMKRQAQQHENAAKYTSLGKVQLFIEREKEMEIADY